MKDKQLLGSRRGCYNSSCHGRHTKLQDLFLSLRSLWSWDQPMIACGPDLACHLFLCGLQGRMVFIFSRGRKKNSKQGDFPSKNTGVGLPFPSPGNLPYPGIKHASVTSPGLAGGFCTISATWEDQVKVRKAQE